MQCITMKEDLVEMMTEGDLAMSYNAAHKMINACSIGCNTRVPHILKPHSLNPTWLTLSFNYYVNRLQAAVTLIQRCIRKAVGTSYPRSH